MHRTITGHTVGSTYNKLANIFYIASKDFISLAALATWKILSNSLISFKFELVYTELFLRMVSFKMDPTIAVSNKNISKILNGLFINSLLYRIILAVISKKNIITKK